MTADDPTAILSDYGGRAHRLVPEHPRLGDDLRVNTACDGHISFGERVPLSSVPTADRCRKCWPESKETDHG